MKLNHKIKGDLRLNSEFNNLYLHKFYYQVVEDEKMYEVTQ